jgi:hypothetical protein
VLKVCIAFDISQLLCELNASDKLPAIVFNFERVLCDHLATVCLFPLTISM